MNEDGLNLKSSNCVKKKKADEYVLVKSRRRFPFQQRFSKATARVSSIVHKYQPHKISIFQRAYYKTRKLFKFVGTLTSICCVYYFYTFVKLTSK